MGVATDSAGAEWHADTYTKGKGREPLKCKYCSAHVTHHSAHVREYEDKSILVPAYFRLLPNGRHAYGCRHAVEQEIKTIAKESEDIFESVRDGQYRLRLMMIKEALDGAGSKPKSNSNKGQLGKVSKVYEHSRNKLPAYINSAKRVLQLRALCDGNDEIAEHLELVFEGNTVVPWPQFYFETEHHLDAYHAILHNTVQHPIAIHGTVKSKKPVDGKYGPTNVLNLIKPRYLTNPDDPDNGIGIEVSIWAKNADWFNGLEENTEVVILGLWKAKPGISSPAQKVGKFKTFTTHKLNTTLMLMAQIARIPTH